MGLTVERFGNRDAAAWSEWVSRSPAATFYHRWEWRDVVRRSFGHDLYYLAACGPGGTVVGGLPIVHVRSRVFGSILCSMPFLNFGGVAADSAEAEAALLAEARRVVEETRADYLELRQVRRTGQGLPTRTHKVSMTVDLDPDPEVVWKALPGKMRTTVRKAERAGLRIRFGGIDLIDPFYRVLERGWRELGTPLYRKSFFRHVLEAFGDDVEIAIVFAANEPAAVAFDGRSGRTREGMWTWALREHIRLQTNYFLYWNLIRRACEQGHERFHLGRSTVGSGGESYKRKWNAAPQPLYWEYMLGKAETLPGLDVANPRFRAAIAAWQRLPLAVTRIVGPLLARSIP